MTLIDKFLPAYQFSERHELLLDALNLPGIVDDPWVQWFIQLREAPVRLLSVVGYHSQLKHKPSFGLGNFTRLGRDDDREAAFGLVAITDAQAFEQFLLADGFPHPYPGPVDDTSNDVQFTQRSIRQEAPIG